MRVPRFAWLAVVAACHFNKGEFNDRVCNSDQDCTRPDQACIQSLCTQKSCQTAADCGGAFLQTCSDGNCVATGCKTTADCGLGFSCTLDFCQASFNVVGAASTTNTAITVTFDAPPDATTATALANYAVDGLALSGTPTLSGGTVTLATSAQTVQTYVVAVQGVTRASDQAPLGIAKASFTGRTAFDVTSAVAATNTSLLVTFDAPPDPVSATTLASYAVQGLTLSGTPVLSGSAVTLATAPQATGTTYTLTVANVTRASDGVPLSGNTATFGGRTSFNVASAAAVTSSTITVTFDAPPNAAQATNIASYSVVDASNNPLALSGTPTLDTTTMTHVTIATAQQTAGTYRVTVAGVTRASDGEPLAIDSASFTGIVPFDVAGAASVTSHSITVTFDAPPSTATAQAPANYSVPGLTLGTPVLSGVTVTIPTSAQSATSYTVTASGVVRASDGEPLSVGTATFVGRPPFDVTGASSLTSHSVAVTFDAPPDATSSQMAGNYSIPGLSVSSATLAGSTVTLTTTAQSATTFAVTVSNVTRASDGEPLTAAVASFTGRPPFDVASATATSSTQFTVTFDAPPNSTQATNVANYSAPGLVLTGVTYPGSGNFVTVTTSTQQSAITFTVSVANVTRASDGEPLTNTTASFTGIPPFDVASATSTGNTSMTVTFDAAPNAAQATNILNYAITSGSLSVSGPPTLSGNTVTLATSAQTSGASYTITVSGVARASDGEALTVASASFTGKSGFNVIGASSVNATTMSVTFDGTPTTASATTLSNYSVVDINNNPLALSGTPTLSGNTVTITTGTQAGTTYDVTVKNGATGVVRTDNTTLTVNTASFVHATFNVQSATAPTSHSVAVTFDATPTTAQATNLANYTLTCTSPCVAPTLSGTPVLSGNTVTISTSAQTGGQTYTIHVANVTRASDGVALSTTSANFTGKAPFDVSSAASATSASMTVTFDAAPNATQATTLANYAVVDSSNNVLPLSGTPVLSGSTVTITTGVQKAVTYTVTVSNVTRASDGEVLTTTTASFTGTAQTKATVTSVTVSSTSPNNGSTFYNTGTATVVIAGTQFTGTSCPTGVALDDQNGNGTVINTHPTSCSVDSDTQITATFPAGIRTNGLTGWDVLVTNTTGMASATSASDLLVVKAGLLIANVLVETTAGSTNQQFFELYNPTANALNVGSTGSNPLGIVFHVRTAGGTPTDTVLAFSFVSGGSHSTIPSHGFMLFASALSSSLTDSWVSHEDATYDTTVTNNLMVSNGSVYLSFSSTAQVRVIDKAGWGSQAAGGFEGTAMKNEVRDQSAQRKPGNGGGDATDTDNNNNDFLAWSSTINPLGTADTPQP